MTATTITAVTIQMLDVDLSRILAGLLTGVGFIGGGVIMRDGTGEVRSLTTAAALWAMTAVAIAIGLGFTVLGLLLTLLVYTVLSGNEWPVIGRLHQWQAKQKTKHVPKETVG